VSWFWHYSYNARGSLKTRFDALNDIQEVFNYDALDLLDDWTYTDSSGGDLYKDYQYDDQGNMTFKTGTGEMRYEDGFSNRLTSRTKPNNAIEQYTYDDNGNMETGDGRTYQWTNFNKVSSVITAQGVTHYAYDGNQNRVKKAANDTTTYYFGRDYEVVIGKDTQGKTVRKMRHHIFAGNELVATHEKVLQNSKQQTDTTAYVHRDALGSVDIVTNAAGVVVQQQRYTPFGEEIKLANVENLYTAGEIRGYTSHENVGETGKGLHRIW